MELPVVLDAPLPIWEYTETVLGTCSISGETITLIAKLRFEYRKDFPDVCKIKQWLVKLAETPTTVEKFACDIRKEFANAIIEVVCESMAHGPIKVKL